MKQPADIVAEARAFAAAAHQGQLKKYSGKPYITHPEAVVALVATRPHTQEMLAAAWLHDTVEDTPVTIEDIRLVFGDAVAALVDDLTDRSKVTDGNRAARKALDRAHTASASPEAKTIKLADLIDNSRSILAENPKFAKVYIPEKAALLEVLSEGDPVLWATANDIVAKSGLA